MPTNLTFDDLKKRVQDGSIDTILTVISGMQGAFVRQTMLGAFLLKELGKKHIVVIT